MTPRDPNADALANLAREHSGQVLASLARRYNDVDVADDAVQDAMIEAANRWPSTGVPENPGGWLYRVAQRKALDRLRRISAERRRLGRIAPDLVFADDEPMDRSALIDDQTPNFSNQIGVDEGDIAVDERLRLVLLCCHPALNQDAQVALTLRLVAGLTTEEIAAAFLVPTPTLAARVTRAKKKIRTANIPLSVPTQLEERLDPVLATLYLIFNEGYLSRAANRSMSIDLCEEAIHLGVVVDRLAETSAEAKGLLALLQLTHARRSARFNTGELVLLEDQDRGQWDLGEIQAANRTLAEAMKLLQPGPYQLQALIASHHSNARTAADTDWGRIVSLYDQLLAVRPTAVVALNRAVAVAMADGPLAGLTELEQIEGLDGYHLFHSARAELLLRKGDITAARLAFEQATVLASNPSEIEHLANRLQSLD